MNDIEYNHTIWINGHELSHEFHYVWSILSFSGKFFSKKHELAAMRFHYASLTPINLDNRKILGLAKFLKKNLKMVKRWHREYHGKLIFVSCENLLLSLSNDAELLIKLTIEDKSGNTSVYRKTLPGGIQQRVKNTIDGLEKYFSSNGIESHDGYKG